MSELKDDAIGTLEELGKPDMQAVLSRTHLSFTLHNFLLPVFEAVSNASHGIKLLFESDAAKYGEVKIHVSNPNDPYKIKISVTDNGIGLNDENYKSFRTPFSGFKLKQHGRGFGRFIAFKVFSRVIYTSRYSFFSQNKARSFNFDVTQEKEFRHLDIEPDFAHSGVRVSYDHLLSPWHDLVRELKVEDVSDAIGSHFLPQFLYGWLPNITIQFDDDAPTSITNHFNSVFVESKSGNIEVEIDGNSEILKYSLSNVLKGASFKSHCLLFSAADRIVGAPRDLANKIGEPYFTDKNNQKYVVLAVVSGTAFEARLNDSRTGINLTPKTIEKIVSAISGIIQEKEVEQIQKIKLTQSSGLNDALRENPIMRLGLRGKSVKEYVALKPNNWTAEQFLSDLAVERYRASSDLSKEIAEAASNPDSYQEKIQKLAGTLDQTKKEALAEYVLHRKSVIELVEAARKFGDQGKTSPEDVIHELIFRRFNDNVSTGYFEHNLWLIDDALAFLPYITSDRTMHGGGRKKGDKVADMVFFDDSMVLGDNDGTTITIAEFKRPGRNDYRFGDEKHDPVRQVTETFKKATARGGVTKTDGSHFSFSNVVRKFAFIIADHKSSLVEVLSDHDFKNDWNPKIFYKYRDREELMIHAFGYDTLIENAKKRNQAFFSVLLGE